MIINDFDRFQELVSKIDKEALYKIICKNIKKYRLEKYNDFKKENSNLYLNPYSTENIAELLNYNHTHYKRFESESDSTKQIPLDKLVMLSIILEKSLDDFLK